MLRGMRRAAPEQMAKWLARGEQRGWGRAELSRRSGYPMWKLRWWAKRLARTHTAEAPGGAFVAVALSEPAPNPSTPKLEVTTPSGYRVQVPAGFEAGHLRRVVQALEASC